MGGVVLLTGATGFVGTEVARRLLGRDRPGTTLVALVLAPDDAEARRLARRAWHHRPELAGAIGGRVEVVAGDVAAPRLGLPPDRYADLVGRVTHVVHAAANVRFDAALEDLRRTNVTGTERVLDLARDVHADGRLERLLHVSTAYVAGLREGEVAEDDLSDASGFANAYERTKHDAERLVRDAIDDGLPVTVARPGMIVGDSRTGEVATFNTVYVLLRRSLVRRARFVPASRSLRVNVVPVDHVADAIVRLLDDPRAEGRTVHLTAPREALPTAAEALRVLGAWARDELGVPLPRPVFVPLARVPGLRRTADRLDVLLPYLRERAVFRRDEADRLLGQYEPRWQVFFPALLRYAAARGFLHRTDRTVHEQAMFRLRSRRLPVRYVDVVDGRAERRAAADVRADVLAAADALRTRLGVGPGTRVAIVGPNGTRYLALDLAIGMLGAVCVPLYPTLPADEIDGVLRASGAEALLVGSPDVLARLGPVASALPLVSFCRTPAPPGVLAWDELVARRDAPPIERAPADLDDLATLRYTSGTTGAPKGVAFTHGQLRWMAETVASLLPWGVRTRPVTYLSFLPMNHVVEGILGAYSAYQLPSPVEVAFVEALGDVPAALRRVRPTVFFSVPRLYERVWGRLEASAAGRRWLAMRDGRARRAVGALVRRRLLRRAGLDRCEQLIVGSAAVPEALLRGFRDLGIEVHQAYGLTEAPLLTLNRRGRNRLGTAGEPLPDTAIRVAEDGEVLARGPQVTVGYVDEGVEQPFRDGWLATGDLGHLTDEGFLVIDGRKKELLKTSYGKYVHAGKIEARLRTIPGVANAMVVAEGRPYCAALLWVDGEVTDDLREAVARGIESIAPSLSHPEQVKRWAVLPDDLSVERGDLTPNLKLRRDRVAARLADEVERLYAREEVRA